MQLLPTSKQDACIPATPDAPRPRIVTLYRADAAARAEAFKRVFQQELPEDMPVLQLGPDGPFDLVSIMVKAGMASSNSEARRLIQQGGVRVDGAVVDSIERQLKPGGEYVLHVGKRRFSRISFEKA